MLMPNTTRRRPGKKCEDRQHHLGTLILAGNNLCLKNAKPTVFLRHICVCNPRRVLRDIKQIPNYRPGWRARWIRQPSSSSMVAKDNKKIKGKRDDEAINGIDEKELHYETGCLRRDDERL